MRARKAAGVTQWLLPLNHPTMRKLKSFILISPLALLFFGCGWTDDDGVERVEKVAANVEVWFLRHSGDNQLALVQSESSAIILASGCKLLCFDTVKNVLFAEVELNKYNSVYKKFVLVRSDTGGLFSTYKEHEVEKSAFLKHVAGCSACVLKRFN